MSGDTGVRAVTTDLLYTASWFECGIFKHKHLGILMITTTNRTSRLRAGFIRPRASSDSTAPGHPLVAEFDSECYDHNWSCMQPSTWDQELRTNFTPSRALTPSLVAHSNSPPLKRVNSTLTPPRAGIMQETQPPQYTASSPLHTQETQPLPPRSKLQSIADSCVVQ